MEAANPYASWLPMRRIPAYTQKPSCRAIELTSQPCTKLSSSEPPTTRAAEFLRGACLSPSALAGSSSESTFRLLHVDLPRPAGRCPLRIQPQTRTESRGPTHLALYGSPITCNSTQLCTPDDLPDVKTRPIDMSHRSPHRCIPTWRTLTPPHR